MTIQNQESSCTDISIDTSNSKNGQILKKLWEFCHFPKKNIFHTHEIVARCWTAIWGLKCAQIKKLKKTDPHYFSHRMGVCFLELFERSHPKASNCYQTACFYFIHLKNTVFGKWHNSHNSGIIGLSLEIEVSMATSLQGDSGFGIVTNFHTFILTLSLTLHTLFTQSELSWPNMSQS